MKVSAEQIDALLPQTQCGQCGYGGCMPYAQALEQGEAITRCPPGGVKTAVALAELLQKKLLASDLELLAQQSKAPVLAQIRSAECIGCTKCLQACPVDAIIGAAKQLHVILAMECTGCGLCVAPCPVDCIDMIESAADQYQPAKARQRFNARQQRLHIPKTNRSESTIPASKLIESKMNAKKAYIQAAVERAKNKKLPVGTGSSDGSLKVF